MIVRVLGQQTTRHVQPMGGEVGDVGPLQAIGLIFQIRIGEETNGAAACEVRTDPGVQLICEPVLVGNLRVRGMSCRQHRAGGQQQQDP